MIDLESQGFATADLVLTESQCEHIVESLPAVPAGRGGVRNLIAHPTVARLLLHERLGAYLWKIIGRDLVAVKATLFDKTPHANWRGQWHQDRVIAVRERLAVPGFGPWTSRAGSLHVEAPATVLSQMLAVRIHLDQCGPDNGPLRVIAGSHQHGKLSNDSLAATVAGNPIVELYAPQGALVLMRPLLVHSSVPAAAPEHRRVLHIVFAPVESISPLQWQNAVKLRRAM